MDRRFFRSYHEVKLKRSAKILWTPLYEMHKNSAMFVNTDGENFDII